MRALVLAAAVVTAFAGEAAAENFQLDRVSYGVSVLSWREIPFRTVVRQEHDFSCGSAAVATLLRYHYGVEVTEAEVFASMLEHGDEERIRSQGFSLLDIRDYLGRAGLSGEGYRLSLAQLADMGVPAIALIRTGSFRHFVVIKGIDEERVLVGDPALGLRTYTRADFEREWNGIAFVVRPADEGRRGAFNQPDEWRDWSPPAFDLVADRSRLGELTRELPPLYQISPLRPLGPD